jgi:hypothetical protein
MSTKVIEHQMLKRRVVITIRDTLLTEGEV